MKKINDNIDVCGAIRDQDASLADIQLAFPNVKRDLLVATLQSNIDAGHIRRYIEGRTVMYGMITGKRGKATTACSLLATASTNKAAQVTKPIKAAAKTVPARSASKPKSSLPAKPVSPVRPAKAKSAAVTARARAGEAKDTFILEEAARLILKDITATRAYTKDEAVKAAERIVASGGSGASSLLVVQIHAIVRPIIKMSAAVEKDLLKVKKK